MRRDPFQYVLQVGPHIESVLLAGRDEAVDDRGPVAPSIAATEQPVPTP